MGAVMEQTKRTPKPRAQVVRDYQAKARLSGAERLPGTLLAPEAAKALQALLASGYAHNKTHVIARALLEAAKQQAGRVV